MSLYIYIMGVTEIISSSWKSYMTRHKMLSVIKTEAHTEPEY